MTFSIVAREPIAGGEDPAFRFGVAVTTNNPGVGVFCPAVSAHGAVATQHRTYGEAGPRILDAIESGRDAPAALSAVVAETDHGPLLQAHALDADSRAVHHGDEIAASDSPAVFGDVSREHCSVAGNTLANRATLTATADAFASTAGDRELADRLIEAITAGDDAGGDRRDADARSAAVRVVDPDAGIANEWYNDLRVDASPTPLSDLRAQYDRAKAYHEEASAGWG